MTDQGESLTRLNDQVEVFQHFLMRCITKIQIAEFDTTPQARSKPVLGLKDARFRIDQGKDPFTGCQAELELTPERGNADQREPEKVDALDEQVKIASGYRTGNNTHATRVHDECGTDS